MQDINLNINSNVEQPLLNKEQKSTKSNNGEEQNLTLLELYELTKIEDSQPCYIRHKVFLVVLFVFIFLLSIAITLSFTFFYKQCAPFWELMRIHQHEIICFGSIPIVSIIFTYSHIWLAIYMMFYPLEFIGCFPPFLGWQGIVPSKADKMASKAVDLITENLIKPRDIFGRLDPKRVAEELEPVLHSFLTELINETSTRYFPTIWKNLPGRVKEELIIKAKENAPEVISSMMVDLKDQLEKIFDIKHMIVSALVANKNLLNRIFLDCGRKEFSFIKISGAYIGFFFGLIQMVIWIFYQAWWILPLTGFIIGYLTNWIAIKLIFNPVEPINICGGLVIQGMFLKRQKEVSVEYSRMVSANILNSRRILSTIVQGPSSDHVLAIVENHIRPAVDRYAGLTKPFVLWSIGNEEYSNIKNQVCRMVVARMPQCSRYLENYADQAMDLESTLREKLGELSGSEFEGMLHPVFEEDEWKLIILGAILGVLVGLLQAFTIQ